MPIMFIVFSQIYILLYSLYTNINMYVYVLWFPNIVGVFWLKIKSRHMLSLFDFVMSDMEFFCDFFKKVYEPSSRPRNSSVLRFILCDHYLIYTYPYLVSLFHILEGNIYTAVDVIHQYGLSVKGHNLLKTGLEHDN